MIYKIEEAKEINAEPCAGELYAIGLFVAFVTSYALLLAGYQMFDLQQDDAAGAFAGVIDFYYQQYGEITSRHGILEALFRHVSADVSIQTARLLVVILGVFPASFAIFWTAARILRIGTAGAMLAASLPFLISGQNVIPFSYNSSYTVFDLLALGLGALVVVVSSRSIRLEIIAPGILFVGFLISEAMNNAPFITPTLLLLLALLRWRSILAQAICGLVIIGATVKVVAETFADRIGSTPGARDGFAFIDILTQFWSNLVETTDAMIGLGAFGAALISAASVATAVGVLLSWRKTGERCSTVAASFALSLMFVPLFGFAVAAEGFQLRYAVYSHVGLALLIGLWMTLVVSALSRGPSDEPVGAINRARAALRRSAPGAMFAAALTVSLTAAYAKSQPSPDAERISALLESYANYFQRPPARAVRSARTHQYLILNDGPGLRASLLPLATSFGYVQFVTANEKAFGWIGPADSCGNPFREDWRFWGRSNLPGGLTDAEPLWVVGAQGRFGRARDLEYLLASDVSDPNGGLGSATWRLYAVGDHAPELLTEGAGEQGALAAMRFRGISPEEVALSCGLRAAAHEAAININVISEARIEAAFVPEAWTSTSLTEPSARLLDGGLNLGANQHAVSKTGLAVRPGQIVTLRYRAEVVTPSTGETPLTLRVGPVGRRADGTVVYWWSPANTRELFAQAMREGQREIFGSRTITVPEDVTSMHIAFRGPVTDQGAEGSGTVRVTEAVLVIETVEQ